MRTVNNICSQNMYQVAQKHILKLTFSATVSMCSFFKVQAFKFKLIVMFNNTVSKKI